VLLVLALVGPAAATTKSANVSGVWLTIGAYGDYADFWAKWDRVALCEPGSCFWSFSYFHTSGAARNGKDCSGEYCVDWAYSSNVKFLSSTGATIATIFPTNGNACIDELWNMHQKWFTACKRDFSVSSSATQVKISWQIRVQRPDGIWFAWNATKTVAI
jgi:hypothetical protein